MSKSQNEPIPSPFQVLLATRLLHALGRSKRHRPIVDLLEEGKDASDLIDLCDHLCGNDQIESARLVNAINKSVFILNKAAEKNVQPKKRKTEVYPPVAACIYDLEMNASKFPVVFDIDLSKVRFSPNAWSETGSFYTTDAWRKIRYEALVLHGGRCQCCGRSPSDDIVLHVDHIKARSRYPKLALELSNLQVLCDDCNLGKGARDETDWRGVHPVGGKGTQLPS